MHFQAFLINSKIFFKLGGLFCLFLIASPAISQSITPKTVCPSSDSSWIHLQVRDRYGIIRNNIEKIDEECFVNVLTIMLKEKNFDNESLSSTINKWIEKHGFTACFLNNIYWKTAVRDHGNLLESLFASFEKKNGGPYQVVTGLIGAGKISLTDSLCEIYNATGKLNAPVLFRWIRVKTLLGKYNMIAPLACRCMTNDPNLIQPALNQLSNAFEDMPADSADMVLRAFLKCSTAQPESDTSMLRSWIADAYEELGMSDREVQTLISLETASSPISDQLIDIAARNFSSHQFPNVIFPAREAYKRVLSKDYKSLAAVLLYQAYMEMGRNDSAIYWIDKADLDSDKRKAEAIFLFQNSGLPKRAQSLLDSLDPSLTADTLLIRQYLLTGDLKNALKFTFNKDNFIQKSRRESALWGARVLLFNDSAEALGNFLDSILIDPSWDIAAELIFDRYWLQRLKESSDALVMWMQIEYNCYIGKPEKSSETLLSGTLDPELKWRLAVRVAKALIAKRAFPAALKLLNGFDENSASSEFLYYKAEVLLSRGDTEKSRWILKQLLMKYPHDVYTGKARVILSHMNTVN